MHTLDLLMYIYAFFSSYLPINYSQIAAYYHSVSEILIYIQGYFEYLLISLPFLGYFNLSQPRS